MSVIKSIVVKNFSKEKYYSFWLKLLNLSLNCIGFGIGGGVDKSGEIEALEYLKNNIMGDKPILFDCGANVGEYTNELLKKFPNANIHSFEPLKITYNKLFNNVKSKSAKLNNIGLSNKIGKEIIHYNENDLGLTSLFERKLDYSSHSLSDVTTVDLTTIDEYCSQNNIDVIDFLKMDIEGAEYNALLGASNMLKDSKIKAIQIEFGGCCIDAKLFFRDYWNMLSKQYYVYRIIPGGLIRIEKYEEKLEIFLTCNYLFVNKNL